MRNIGRGRNGLASFCGLMNMLPPVVPSSYSVHLANLAEISMEASANNTRAASAHLHSSLEHKPDEVIDVAVTCDGTWYKRRFTATYGVVVPRMELWRSSRGRLGKYRTSSLSPNAASAARGILSTKIRPSMQSGGRLTVRPVAVTTRDPPRHGM